MVGNERMETRKIVRSAPCPMRFAAFGDSHGNRMCREKNCG